ncbi:MAG: hypothetical protein JWO52_6913 [Gammaproteobacteria bacterium]|jgi:hypothetical protein|nr:hypothetical protein [Gammaproteobacteria bacterium]
MSALKLQFQRARVILDSLVQGLHPKTGGELPKDSVVNEIDRQPCDVDRCVGT